MRGRLGRGAVVALAALVVACSLPRQVREAIDPPRPTPTTGWVGKTEESATPLPTFQSRVSDVDSRTGQQLTAPIALRQGPGRGAEPNGFSVQPGERVFVTGAETVGNERFLRVRSFDGLRTGWLAESALVPTERPPA